MQQCNKFSYINGSLVLINNYYWYASVVACLAQQLSDGENFHGRKTLEQSIHFL